MCETNFQWSRIPSHFLLPSILFLCHMHIQTIHQDEHELRCLELWPSLSLVVLYGWIFLVFWK